MNNIDLILIKNYIDKKSFGGGGNINISGKEDKSNKITSLSSDVTDTQYPSAKLMYDWLALKVNNSDIGNAKIYYGVCSTESNVAQKNVSCSVYTRTGDPVRGDIIYVTFDYTNNAASEDISLKVNNSAAKHIVFQNTTGNGSLPIKNTLIANNTYRFIYNGSNWVVMLNHQSDTLQRIYASDRDVEFPISGEASGGDTTKGLSITTPNSNAATFSVVPASASNKATINASTGRITVPGGITGDLTGTASKAVADESGNVITSTYAPLVNPTLTGVPLAPTAAAGTNTTQIATTAFVQQAIQSPFKEMGTIVSNNDGWYNSGTQITGTYALIGDMCILRAYAGTKRGWGEVYYTLPVAAVQGASTTAYENGHQYMISTGLQDNYSVCTIRKIGGGNQEGDDTIQFTLFYKYQ